MTEVTSNDNERHAAAAPREPDAHGQAALLLVESLIHALIERAVISIEEAVAIVDLASDVKQEIGDELGDSPATLKRSLGMLQSIRASLEMDIRPV